MCWSRTSVEQVGVGSSSDEIQLGSLPWSGPVLDIGGERVGGQVGRILASFGGGYTWGSIYVKWAYDGENC
jgi:hypothetical protein